MILGRPIEDYSPQFLLGWCTSNNLTFYDLGNLEEFGSEYIFVDFDNKPVNDLIYFDYEEVKQ